LQAAKEARELNIRIDV